MQGFGDISIALKQMGTEAAGSENTQKKKISFEFTLLDILDSNLPQRKPIKIW